MSSLASSPSFIRRRREALLASALGSALVIYSPAAQAAQAAESPATKVAADEAEGTSGEILVTAQRRTERLEDVPMAITHVSGETLEKSGVTSMLDLGQVASGVIVSYAAANVQPSVRGITSVPAGPYYENNVSVFIDGIYQIDPLALNMDIANLESIQVLKGPQGTLYGRNATGGAIIVNTLAPSKTFTANLNASYATLNEKTFSAYVSGPVASWLRLGVAAFSRTSDGWYKLSDPVTGQKSDINAAPITKQYVRLKAEADITNNLTATLGANYIYSDDATGFLFTPTQYAPASTPLPPIISPTPLETKSNDTNPVIQTRVYEGNLKLAWQNSLGTLTSITSYSDEHNTSTYDLDGTYAPSLKLSSSLPRKNFQQALNYSITAVKNLDLLIGGSYIDHHIQALPNITVTNGVVTLIRNQINSLKGLNFYIDGTYHLTDKLTLTAGVGYARDKISAEFYSRTPAQEAAGTYTVSPVQKDATFSKFTPRVTLRYEIAPRTNVYASFSKGFKAGAWQQNATPTVPVRPENIAAYEVGLKTVGSNFRLETSAFYYDYRDIQTAVNIPQPGCTAAVCPSTNIVFNGPRAKVYGIDGEFTWTPVENLTLSVGASYIHARYGTFTNATGTGLNSATQINITNQVQIWTGQQLPRAPDYSGHVGIDYVIRTTSGNIGLTLNGTFTDSYVVSNPSLYGPLATPDLQNKQRYRQSGYVLLNGQIGWTDPSDRYSLTVFARNVTNKRYAISYSTNGNQGDYLIYSAPRQIGARLGVRF